MILVIVRHRSPRLSTSLASSGLIASLFFAQCRDYELNPNGPAGGGGRGGEAGCDAACGGVISPGGGTSGAGVSNAGREGGAGGANGGEGGDDTLPPRSGSGGNGNVGGSGNAGGEGGGGAPEPVCRSGEALGTFENAVAMTATRNPDGTERLYVAQIATDVVGTTARIGPTDHTWSAWACFDPPPEPARLAGTERADGSAELFAVTRDGRLFARRSDSEAAAWSSWTVFDLPSPESVISDVAATAGSELRNHVYVVDRGSVFVRWKVGDQATADYGAWTALGGTDARRIAACMLPNLAQIVIALRSDGGLVHAAQADGTVGAAFGAFQEFPLAIRPEWPALLDLECASLRGLSTELYVLDAAGTAHGSLFADSQWFGWNDLDQRASYIRPLTSLGAVSAANDSFTTVFYGASETGQISLYDRGIWDALPPTP